MNVKIFKTKTLGILAAEVLEENGSCCGQGCGKTESWLIRNPKHLQYLPENPSDPSNKNMVPHWLDVIQKPILEKGYFETTIHPCEYEDVTDQFKTVLVDFYKTLEGEQPVSEEVEEGTIVDLFGNK